jgi:RND family efflux transporter MFP subunit
LEAAEKAEVRHSDTRGQVQEILVASGDRVEAGETLMVLSPDQTAPQLDASLAGVDVAIGARDNALKALDVAKAQLDSAQSTARVDSVNAERSRQLASQGAISQLNFDEAVRRAEVSRNNVTAAQEQVAAAEVQVQQAEASIRQAQAQADAAQISVSLRNVVSPIAGVLDNIPVKVGDYVNTGEAVARVTQLDALLLNLQVPSNRGPRLRTGLPVELLDPNSQEVLATGSLSFVSPTVDPQAQTILTKAQFRNPNGKLRDGQYVRARIIWESQPGLLIPVNSVTRVGGRNFVYVVAEQPNENGQTVVRLTPVELGDIQGNSYQVISGLEQGDRIAVSNILKLQDGVAIESASANKADQLATGKEHGSFFHRH